VSDERDLSVVVCVSCGEKAGLLYESGGWWDLPEGWLMCALASGTEYACSRICARRREKGRADP